MQPVEMEIARNVERVIQSLEKSSAHLKAKHNGASSQREVAETLRYAQDATWPCNHSI